MNIEDTFKKIKYEPEQYKDFRNEVKKICQQYLTEANTAEENNLIGDLLIKNLMDEVEVEVLFTRRMINLNAKK